MKNNLYQSLNNNTGSVSSSNLNGIKQLAGLLQNSSNPQQLIFNLIQNNPQIRNIYSLLQNSNKNPKELFYLMAQQKGIDPDQVINLLK